MPATFAITVPIFVIVAIGFLAVRLGLFAKAEIRPLSAFVLHFALPALIFKAVSQASLAQIANVPYLLAYTLGSAAVMLGGIVFARFARKEPLSFAALYGLGMTAANSGFIGFPIALQLLGPPAVVALALTMLVENIVIIPLALVLLESSRSQGNRPVVVIRTVFIRLFRNPLILAILAGTTLVVLEVPLPGPLTRVVDLFAMAAGAVALFVIGGSLVGLKIGALLGDVFRIVAGKLILHPLAVLAALLLLPPFDPLLQMAAFTFACMPVMSIYPLLGERYGHKDVCAAAMMIATAASFVSISTLLWLVDATGLLAARPPGLP